MDGTAKFGEKTYGGTDTDVSSNVSEKAKQEITAKYEAIEDQMRQIKKSLRNIIVSILTDNCDISSFRESARTMIYRMADELMDIMDNPVEVGIIDGKGNFRLAKRADRKTARVLCERCMGYYTDDSKRRVVLC